ncbi:MAG: Smr/MutS family protein [Paracoccaceae bacterium]
MARRRTLRPDEADLWHAVARTARPMYNPHLPLADPAPPAPVPEVKHPAQPRIPPFTLGERAAPARPAPPVAQPLMMDARTHARMTRGKLAPEARIDLHGMTLSEAHPELIHFILNAQSAGLRLVLVITGKGRMMHEPVPRPVGALRHQVPHWLRLPPLGQAVLQITDAHLKHGGTGAYYVYLRRR